MKIVVGLGNPGQKYEDTRHNIGFRMVALLAKEHGIRLGENRCCAVTGRGSINGVDIIIARPMTYMNRSGLSCRCLGFHHSVSPGDFIMVYDDVDLPPGQLRFRLSGGHGGHKGMLSVISHLKTRHIPRIRLGIGRPAAGEVSDYVLGSFSLVEEKELKRTEEKFLTGIEAYLGKGVQEAMTIMNRREYNNP